MDKSLIENQTGAKAPGPARAYLLLALAALFWAGNVVLGRAVRNTISPAALVFWRWLIALLVLLPLTGAEVWRQRQRLRDQWKSLSLLGFLGCFLYQAMAYEGLRATSALNALLIVACLPLLTAVLNWLAFREPISARLGAGIALSLAGVLAVFCHGDWRVLRELRFNFGDLITLAATGVWAVYSMLLERYRPPGWSPAGLVTVTALGGMVFATPFFLWRTALGERMACVLPNVLAVVYIGVFASVLAYLFWNEGIAASDATVAGLFVNLTPVFGAVLAVVFLGETFASYHLLATLLVCAGIVLGRTHRKSPTPGLGPDPVGDL